MNTLKTLVELGADWNGFTEIYTALQTPTNGMINPIDLSTMESEYDRKAAINHMETPNHNEAEKQIKTLIMQCDDIDTLKVAAIKFDEIKEFYMIEDRLVELIGDDYYDFADENDLA